MPDTANAATAAITTNRSFAMATAKTSTASPSSRTEVKTCAVIMPVWWEATTTVLSRDLIPILRTSDRGRRASLRILGLRRGASGREDLADVLDQGDDVVEEGAHHREAGEGDG